MPDLLAILDGLKIEMSANYRRKKNKQPRPA